MKDCVWCGTAFEPTTTYQVYCSVDCRKAATKQKIKDRSRAALIKRRAKKPRMCVNGCGTQLSVYNDGKYCNRCGLNNKMVDKALKNIESLFDWEDEL
jgi:predicted nucleic acid-binding Zn ribbon protein